MFFFIHLFYFTVDFQGVLRSLHPYLYRLLSLTSCKRNRQAQRGILRKQWRIWSNSKFSLRRLAWTGGLLHSWSWYWKARRRRSKRRYRGRRRMYPSSSGCNAWIIILCLLRKCKHRIQAYHQPKIRCPFHRIDVLPYVIVPRSSSRIWMQRGWEHIWAIWRRAKLKSTFRQYQLCIAMGFSWNNLVTPVLEGSFAYQCPSCVRSRRRNTKGLARRSWWCCTFDRSIIHTMVVQRKQHRNQNRIMGPHTRSSYRSYRGQAKNYVCKPHDHGKRAMVLRIWTVQ